VRLAVRLSVRRSVGIERLEHFVRRDRGRTQFPDFDASGIIRDDRRFECRRACREHCREIRSHRVASAHDIVHLSRGRWYAMYHGIRRHERHPLLTKCEQQVIDTKSLERRWQRGGMVKINCGAECAFQFASIGLEHRRAAIGKEVAELRIDDDRNLARPREPDSTFNHLRDEHALVVVLEHEGRRIWKCSLNRFEHKRDFVVGEIGVVFFVESHELLRPRHDPRLCGGRSTPCDQRTRLHSACVEMRTQRTDYGRTTGEWLRRLRLHETEIRAKYGDTVFDDYDRYLRTCVKAFDAEWSSDVQMKLRWCRAE